jgi:hypothetical protein
MATPKSPMQLTGGAGGASGPAEAGGMLDNPFASGPMNVNFAAGGSASSVAGVPWYWIAAGAVLAGLVLWKNSK